MDDRIPHHRPAGDLATGGRTKRHDAMELLTNELKKKLIRNGETRNDSFPVVKFFDP